MEPLTITITSSDDPTTPITESQLQRIDDALSRVEDARLVRAYATAGSGQLVVTMVFDAPHPAAWHTANGIYLHAVLDTLAETRDD